METYSVRCVYMYMYLYMYTVDEEILQTAALLISLSTKKMKCHPRSVAAFIIFKQNQIYFDTKFHFLDSQKKYQQKTDIFQTTRIEKKIKINTMHLG